MNTKHTEGPWEIESYARERVIEIKAKNGRAIVATVYFNDWDRDANARLIAAAPELLEAAIKVNALSIQSDAHRELRDAISKATGASHVSQQ